MRHLMLRTVLAIVGVTLAGSAYADPIVITAGRLSYDTGDPPSFVLVGEGFRVQGLFPQLASPVPCGSPCAPGTSADLGGRFGTASRDFNLGQGIVTIGANTYGTSFGPGAVALRGELAFETPPALVPSGNGTSVVRLTETFAFSGHITGFGDPAATDPLFAVDLTGTGQALLALDPQNRFIGVSYTFGEAAVAPTPEPGTGLLVTVGLAGCLLGARLRPRACRQRF
jgi:hypothetical protein